MKVTLEIIEGREAGKRFELNEPRAAIVGRKEDESVPFKVDDPRFSRYHFMLESNTAQCFLRDLGSTNGTLVNGQEVRQAELRDGDIIQSGRKNVFIKFRVQIAQADDDCPKPPAPPADCFDVSMDTLPVGELGEPVPPGQLRCAMCKALPGEDVCVANLADTTSIVYVCRDCRDQAVDKTHPVPNYEVLEVVGRGSFGHVYKARRQSSGTLAALKLLPAELTAYPVVAGMFLRQMRLSAKLKHPNIVPVIEMGQAGDQLWVATEYVEGTNAADLAARLGGKLPLRDAVDIVCQTLAALEFAHGQNLVHRDVKPPNILVSGTPGSYAARLSDFGLVKNIDEAGLSHCTSDGERRGTIPFMAPEQVLDSRSVRPACDIYAAGATLYWLLTGQYVYNFEARDPRGERKDPFLVILDGPVVPILDRDSSIPASVARIIERSLHRDPEERFETAAQMAHELRRTMGKP